MNKKQIIKILQNEVGFLDIIEEEDSLGELYISEAEFRELEEIIRALKRKKAGLEESIKFYKRKILKNEGGIFVHKEIGCLIKDKNIVIEGDLIFFDNENLIISNNFLSVNSPRLKKSSRRVKID